MRTSIHQAAKPSSLASNPASSFSAAPSTHNPLFRRQLSFVDRRNYTRAAHVRRLPALLELQPRPSAGAQACWGCYLASSSALRLRCSGHQRPKTCRLLLFATTSSAPRSNREANFSSPPD
ncbi:hypothetical protein L596_015694 [Steinernema carpocapsae]|uniref:Uncharacterized protein n=1 Tax=Steinernema carpocapsae TaxID=34508 RepID=A0A4V6A355_STECR|nr:hypothetical protein L596_015694 [Steinernema carpocapsae]